MKTLFQNELDIKQNQFKSWDEAAKSTVQSIFTFSYQCGHSGLADIVNDVNSYLSCDNWNLPSHYINEEYYSYYLSYLKSLINFYIEQEMHEIDPQKHETLTTMQEVYDSIRVHQAFFLLASHCSISMFNLLSKDPNYSGFVNVILNPSMIANTVVKKQNDYGPENVAKFGMWGLIVRLHDKIARFENLMSKNRAGKNSVSDETIYDTLLDIVGYSTVAILWTNGWFFLPLEKDMK